MNEQTVQDDGELFTKEQWWRLCDVNVSLPVPLAQADLSKPFVYDRKYGVFYCPSGYHQAAMSVLLAFQHGCLRGPEVGQKLGLGMFSDATADYYLENTPGTAFRSSVGKAVQSGIKGNLTVIERRLLGKVVYLFDSDA